MTLSDSRVLGVLLKFNLRIRVKEHPYDLFADSLVNFVLSKAPEGTDGTSDFLPQKLHSHTVILIQFMLYVGILVSDCLPN